MLINKSKDLKSIKFNGIVIDVKPGAKLDVRAFNVAHTVIGDVERHIMIKNPNTFEQKQELTDSTSVDEFNGKVKEYEAKIKELSDARDEATAALKEANDKIASLIDEAQGQGKQIENLKSEVSNLKAKLKNVK